VPGGNGTVDRIGDTLSTTVPSSALSATLLALADEVIE